jgi:ribose transport system ATP-binding protein
VTRADGEVGARSEPEERGRGPAVLQVQQLGKTFAGRRVLRDVALSVHAGEVHGLVGQNGSGKSTLIKILSGYHSPDPGGTVSIDGSPVHLPLAPDQTHRHGLAFVHQDLGLAPDASVLENLRIGQFRTRLGRRVDWRHERRVAGQALAEFGVHVDITMPIGRLPPVDRAMIAIVRALQRIGSVDRGVLFLDEPTAYLPRDGLDRLYRAIARVASGGHGVVLVSHKLDEVLQLTDRITILRDGAVVDTVETSAVSEEDVVRRILGFDLVALTAHAPPPDRPAHLTVRGLAGGALHPLDLSVRAGEVVGCTGLLGSGFEDLPYLLFGATPPTAGQVTVGDRTVPGPTLDPVGAMDLGMALIPADRGRDSGVLEASAAENLTLVTLPRFFAHGRLDRKRERARAEQLMVEFGVVPPIPDQKFAEFSGGNQQKIVFARWTERNPSLFLMHEPAQGVDVGARQDIFRRIREDSAHGVTFLVASAEYADLPRLCDRVLVFRHGRVISELSGGDLTEERILEDCFRTAPTTDGRRHD